MEQAREELKLIPQYASWKIWEVKQPAPSDDRYAELFEGLTPAEVEQRCLQPLLDKTRADQAAAAAAQVAASKPAAKV